MDTCLGSLHHHRMASEREPFLSMWPLIAVVVFGLNNFWWKWAYPGWVVGKLSDVCMCFFLPLYLAWVLCEVFASSAPLKKRVRWGAWITVAALASVKATVRGSDALNAGVLWLTSGTPLHFAPNLADATDLLALPMVLVAVAYAEGERSKVQRTAHGGT